MSKYRAKTVVIDGIAFDSKKEGKRYEVLRDRQADGEISNLQLQQRYKLIPTQKDEVTGETLRGVTYVADFCYEQDGHTIVEDVKASRKFKRPEYIIKRKLMLYELGISVKEIYNATDD